jgi:hypothetical protein
MDFSGRQKVMMLLIEMGQRWLIDETLCGTIAANLIGSE